MNAEIEEKINEISKHFANITEEEFEENLKKSGYGIVKPTSEFDS